MNIDPRLRGTSTDAQCRRDQLMQTLFNKQKPKSKKCNLMQKKEQARQAEI